MPRENEVDRRALSAPSGSQAIVSGALTAAVCHKLVINVTTALTNLAIRTLDGNAPSLGAVPVGLFTFDVQFDMVTITGGAATAVGFYHI